jgi:DNA-binding PadR family transcriptional regulator
LFFTQLKNLTNASDGNLSVQLKKLEGWEYIKSEKKLINGKGVTQYQITEIGIKQFEEYVVFLESVIADKDNGIQ